MIYDKTTIEVFHFCVNSWHVSVGACGFEESHKRIIWNVLLNSDATFWLCVHRWKMNTPVWLASVKVASLVWDSGVITGFQ